MSPRKKALHKIAATSTAFDASKPAATHNSTYVECADRLA